MKHQLILSLVLVSALLAGLLASPAWAGCGRWVVRDNTDYLADPIFDEAIASPVSSGSNESAVDSEPEQNRAEENATAPSVEAAAPRVKAPIIDLAGKWRISMSSFQEEQSGAKALDIILIQTGERLQGYGTILIDGSDVAATATGGISGDDISLDVNLNSRKEDYRMDLLSVGSQLQGNYELYQMETLAESGNATATRSGN